MPNIYVISGCNGAGKTTASYTVLPDILNCKEFVNADNIAAGISPFNPESVALSAGRIMLERIHELIKEGADFAFETTLSTKSYRNLILDAQRKGYTVTLLYFWLDSPALAIQRVKKRVERGGHHIPDDVVERRYHRGLAITNEDLKNSTIALGERIRGGVQKALRKLAEESAAKGESLVVKIDGEIDRFHLY